MASEQTQSTFETFSISEQFQSSFRAVSVQSRMAIEAAIEISSTFVALPVAVQLQSSYRAVSEQFPSNFSVISNGYRGCSWDFRADLIDVCDTFSSRAILEQFRWSSRANSVQFQDDSDPFSGIHWICSWGLRCQNSEQSQSSYRAVPVGLECSPSAVSVPFESPHRSTNQNSNWDFQCKFIAV